MKTKAIVLMTVLALQAAPLHAQARKQTLKLLTAGAFREAALAIVPAFEARSGMKVEVTYDTAGALVKRITGGEDFDVVVVNREGISRLVAGGAVARDSARDVATVGIGIGIREGAPHPPLATVEQFKNLLHAAKHVAYIDPAAGGTAGIYLEGLFARLNIADEIRAKAILVPGGFAAERIVRGEADIALQQASEILPVKGVALAGMLPADIQSYTTYSAGLSRRVPSRDGASALLEELSNQRAAGIIRSKGMQPVH